MSNTPITLSPEIKCVQEQFENWRSSRNGKREPIPQQLWQAAVELCNLHGITQVSRSLRLSYVELKKRVLPPTPATPPTFMEFDASCLASQWHLSCHRPDGARLQVSGSGRLPDIANMLGVFLP